MPTIYITGVEGAGKTRVCKYLRVQGYNALDIDDYLARRYYKNTWKLSEDQASPLEMDFDWYNEREWKIKPSDLRLIKERAGGNLIFLCGIAENFKEINDIVDKTFCLTLPEDVVIQRAQTRDDNFGKNEAQLKYILNKRQSYEEDNKRSGSIMIDAMMPLSKVVETILQNIV